MDRFQHNNQQLMQIFEDVAHTVNAPKQLTTIFKIALQNKSLFPVQKNTNSDQKYIKKWIMRFMQDWENPPSSKIISAKSLYSDLAVKLIVQLMTNASETTVNNYEQHHKLFMAAENVQGKLLEEYIANNIEDYGWLWCQGMVLRSIDFCANDGHIFLQIKNKFNTENSSGRAIRNNTKILKWNRLSYIRQDKCIKPIYHWSELNDIINGHSRNIKGHTCQMSEEKYLAFLKTITFTT